MILSGIAGECIDLYSLTVASNDTAQNVVTIDSYDGTTATTLVVLVTGGSQPATVPALSTIPIRDRRGGSIRATVAPITATKVTASAIRTRT